MRAWSSAALVGLTILAVPAVPAAAQQPIDPLGQQLRLTQTGPDGNAAIDAERAALAHDAERDRYLLVYDAVNPALPAERWVFARLLNGDGTPRAAPLPLARADTAAGGDSDEVPSPDVAFSPGSDAYVVVFSGVPAGAAAGHHEISTVSLSADGGIGTGPTRISTTASLADPERDAQRPAIAHDPENNRFLVAWESDGFGTAANEEFEIFARLVDPAGQAFEATRRISAQGPDGDSGFDAFAPRVTYVPSSDRHVVVWGGDTGTVGNSEVFVETVNPVTGAGSSQRQVSDFPAPSTQDALAADVALNAGAGELLVAFLGEQQAVSGLRDSEVFVQRLAATNLDEIGSDTRISSIGPPGSTAFNATMPRVRHHPGLDRYLVTWRADGAAAGMADNEWEMFGQVLGPTAGQIGDDRRISTVGVDGVGAADAVEAADDTFFAHRYGVAVNVRRREWLVAFAADPQTDDEFEIFGRRFGENPDADGDGFPVPPGGTDCDDRDPAVHPGAVDVPENGRDEDCAGGDAVNLDRDGDGGTRPGDCNDGDPAVHLGAVDVPENGRDEDCVGGDAIDLDHDDDGANRPDDCVDENPFIRRGVRDIPGNGVDEDCSGADTPVLIRAGVLFEFVRFTVARVAVITRLDVVRVRRGMRVRVSCRGRGCPRVLRRAKALRVKRRGRMRLACFLARARLRPGAVVEVRVQQRGFIGRVDRLVVGRNAKVKRTTRCLPPGAKRPKRCPD
jgi:hypothetical protein